MKIGIISFAHPHALSYIRVLASRSDIEILATDPGYADRCGEAGGPAMAADASVGYVETLAELLSWKPDAVIVCTENARHRHVVEQAAAAGAHVLCEKPLATTVADARAMISACERAGVLLMTAYPVRFSPAFTALKDAVDAGTVGELQAVSGANNGRLPTERAWFADPLLAGGGAVMDHTVHIADLLDALMPDTTAVSVYAQANRVLHAERAQAETGGLVSIEYGNGVIATIDCSWSMPTHNPVWGGLRLHVLGTRGLADMDAFDAQRIEGFSEHEREPVRIDYGADVNALMLDEFIDCVATGRTPGPDGQSGLRSMSIALAAYESLRTGRPVSMEEASPAGLARDRFRWRAGPGVAGAR